MRSLSGDPTPLNDSWGRYYSVCKLHEFPMPGGSFTKASHHHEGERAAKLQNMDDLDGHAHYFVDLSKAAAEPQTSSSSKGITRMEKRWLELIGGGAFVPLDGSCIYSMSTNKRERCALSGRPELPRVQARRMKI
ncbi:hypothetical protein T10_9626 [Trichinella papuae]|uniref:Uncharacterized protein n=1 Tax=Trichinella papuae TaxID=268474 RepID=A0A0V1MTE7_9BILA|nr:hypothetical protein T10_9626 [Trichinella papuae]